MTWLAEASTITSKVRVAQLLTLPG